MKAYYGTRFSPHMTKTPEDFLICHDVPISRIGWLKYLGQELGLNDLIDQFVEVYRSPEELFSSATIASFEGKSVTDGHPSDDVRADNYSSYEKGQVTNVRRSKDSPDLLLADLIVKDPMLISEIQNNKREVSCGYICNYEPIGDGKYEQKDIRGNHVAVVVSGRAGDRVSIKDEKPTFNKPVERSKKMDRKTLLGKMLSVFARDAEPEELAEASKIVGDSFNVQPPATVQPPVTKPAEDEGMGGDPAVAELTKQVQALTQVVSQLVQSDKQVHEQMNDLDSLEAELQKPPVQTANDVEGEESVTIPAEQMNQDEEGPVSPAEERPKNPIPGADRNILLNTIKVIKPIIAAIPDPIERRKASDALAKTFRDQMNVQPTNQTDNGYAFIQNATSTNARKAQDNKPKIDPVEEGKDWAKKFNPHYKKEAK